MKTLYGAIEAGGTKFVCAVGERADVLERVQFPTTSPAETLAKVVDFFQPYQVDLAAIGVGSFGPICLDHSSSQYGFITSTPKPGWANTDVVGYLKRELSVPVAFDTDVNAAAIGELNEGHGRGLNNFVYITVGTGIGGGVVANGKLVYGLVHPEVGHLFITQHVEDDFAGACPFHQNRCLEGLCSGPAISQRWQMDASELPADHKAWDWQAFYLAQAAVTLTCVLSPERIILGGGVMEQTHLFKKVRQQFSEMINGYIQHERLLNNLDEYIVPVGVAAGAGIVGAWYLAKNAIQDNACNELK